MNRRKTEKITEAQKRQEWQMERANKLLLYDINL